jgi:predicted transcriptional regulator
MELAGRGNRMKDDNPRTRERVFEFIIDYKRIHDGLAPGIKEIAKGCVLSVSTVKYHLLRLENEDRIRIVGRRAIEVIGGVWNPPGD